MKRTLVITQDENGMFTAFDGARVADKMQDDEALGVVAYWLINSDRPMRYSTAVENCWETERRIRKNIEDALRPVDRLLLQEKRLAQPKAS